MNAEQNAAPGAYAAATTGQARPPVYQPRRESWWVTAESTWLPIAQVLLAVAFLGLWQLVGSIKDLVFYTSSPLLVAKQLQTWSEQGV